MLRFEGGLENESFNIGVWNINETRIQHVEVLPALGDPYINRELDFRNARWFQEELERIDGYSIYLQAATMVVWVPPTLRSKTLPSVIATLTIDRIHERPTRSAVYVINWVS